MANESNDQEIPLRQLLTDFKRDIRSIKTRLTKLTTRLETLELMGFQDQISLLGNEYKSIKKDVLAVANMVSLDNLETISLHMQEAITLAEIPDVELRRQLREHLAAEYAKAKEKIGNTNEPFQVIVDFRKECIRCSLKYNLKAFRPKP